MSARGSIAFWEVSPGVYATEVGGYMTRDMAQLIIERAEPLYALRGRVYGFHNWFEMENYESSCRVELTAWVLGHRDRTELHIGLRSRLVAMGVSVANLALGSLIQVHSDMRSLASALATAQRASL
ncbi:MAG TPA: hypothetical protein VJV78_44685 [Polyangiales bacterium]|nr:hypothetical protein [Polyangiales bacterium]